MAENLDDELEAGEGAADDEEGEGAPKKRGRKTLFLIIGGVLIVIIGGLAGAWFTGLLDPLVTMITGEQKTATVPGKGGATVAGSVVFLDLPEILVNLNTGGRKSTFLKLRVSLELANPKDVPQVEALMTRITDTFNVYLRELRIDDLEGSAGMYRLREELLKRVNAAVAPIKVHDVLFKEMLVQ